MSIDKLKALRAEIDVMIAAAEKKNGADSRRLARMQAAAADPAMEPTVRYVVGRLKTLGMDLHASAEPGFLGKLDAAMREQNVKPSDRFAIKSALARVGAID
jgi:hypothetical protein